MKNSFTPNRNQDTGVRIFLLAITLNVLLASCVVASSLEVREMQLIWQVMWEDKPTEKPRIVEFKFNPEIREFKARVR